MINLTGENHLTCHHQDSESQIMYSDIVLLEKCTSEDSIKYYIHLSNDGYVMLTDISEDDWEQVKEKRLEYWRSK